MPYSNESKHQLKDRLEKMTRTEQTEILKIILENEGKKHSENTNGSFINMSLLSDDTIGKLMRFVEFCEQNNSNLEKTEEYMREMNKSIIKK